MKTFSYEKEKEYYSDWPQKEKPYLHLEKYLRCWLNPEEVFTGKKILDIGAGECEYSRLIAEKFNPKEVIACELFAERMKYAKETNKNPNLKFVVGDCFNLPFDNDSFDVVFGSLVLHQLPNLIDALKEVRRVLKKNGIYVGFEPNPFNIINIYRHFFKKHSQNQYLFWPSKISPQFKTAGFSLKTSYFYAKLPWVKSRFIGTCMGITAKVKNE